MNRLRHVRGEDGITLVELLVSMIIMVIFFSVFCSIAFRIFDSTTNQQARAQNLDSNRGIVQVLDRQVRYANAINAPTTVNGSQYVTFRQGSINALGVPSANQTCYQWRVSPVGRMEYRSWLLPFTLPATTWHTVGTGVGPVGAAAVFSLTSPIDGTATNRQELTVTFDATHGVTPVDTATKVAFAALNTRTASTPAGSVCQEVPPV